MDTAAATNAWLLEISRLLLAGLLVWMFIDWLKHELGYGAKILLVLILIFAILGTVLPPQPIRQGNLPYPLNPNTPNKPSIVQ